MTRKVVITVAAAEDEAAIVSFITDRFGSSYAGKFRDELFRVLHLISRYPYIGRPAKQFTDVRVFLFNKQNKLIYKVTAEHVVILRLLNTRTDLSSRY